MKNPKDFTKFPWGSIFLKSEYEAIARNIMVILGRTGNKFRKLSWREYKAERLKDKDFSEGEKRFFIHVVDYCKSANKAKTFSQAWNS